jgi:hypothetical protein
MTTPIPVTASVLAKDLAERALATFVQAVVPFLILAFQATNWGDAKALGMSALAAGAAALLSLLKGIAAQRLTGTASASRVVGEASTVVPPVQPDDDGYVGRHGRPHPGPLNEGI